MLVWLILCQLLIISISSPFVPEEFFLALHVKNNVLYHLFCHFEDCVKG